MKKGRKILKACQNNINKKGFENKKNQTKIGRKAIKEN